MSSHAKDPLQKQDTSSESSDTPSDSEIDEAEDNLGHLKIEESSTKEAKKDDSDESKPLDSPNQEGTLTSNFDLLGEPIAGPSGLQEPRLESSDGSSDTGCKAEALKDPQQEQKLKARGIDEDIGIKMAEGESNIASEKDMEAKGIDENIGARMVEQDPSSSLTGVSPLSISQGRAPSAGPSVFRGDIDNLQYPFREVVSRFMGPHHQISTSLRRYAYATDSANTSSDVSDIRSEIYDSSREGSVYHDAPEDFEKEESPSYVSAVERQQSSENSDTNASEIQDFVRPTSESSSVSTSSSVSMSTPSGEQGHRAYLDQLQREADARGEPMSTSSGIGSTDQSELSKRQAWNLAGERGYYRHDVDDPNQDLSDNLAEGGQQLPTSEPMEDEPSSGDQQMQDFDRLFEQEGQNVENREGMNMPEDESRASTSRVQLERGVKVSDIGAGSPYKRRRPSKPQSDVSKSEQDIVKPRPKYKLDAGKKSKMVTSKSCPALRPSSESPEPKSSSSDELHRKESPDIKSEEQEISKSETRKPYKTRGGLRRMQYPTVSSQDSIIVEEEEDGTSPLRQQDPGLMETEDHKSIKATPVKASEGPSETSEAKPSTVSSDQAYGSEAEGTLKEQEESFEESEFQRSVGKSKREQKPSNSPPAEEKPDSAPKAATSRPKKRAKAEKMPGKTRRVRHDSGGNVPKSVSLGNIKQSESTSSPDVSDYTPSDDEKDTQS